MNYGELKLKMDAKAVSVPVAGENTGVGTMSQPKASHAAPVETWTVTCKTGAATFTVTGSVSLLQTQEATPDLAYVSDSGEVSFIIAQGDPAFAETDEFTFAVSNNVVGMNDAAEIREIEFRVHSQVDDVKVGYDAENDAVRVMMID